jgi:hypothetical protein
MRQAKDGAEVARVLEPAAFWLIALVFCGVVFLQSWGMTDFKSYYAAGKLARLDAHALYSIPAQAQEQAAIQSGRFFPWAHLPPEAALLSPFTLASFKTAFDLWQAVNLLLLMVALYPLKSYFRGYSAAALALTPVAIGLCVGQDHILMLLIFVLTFLSLKSGKEFRAGGMLGIGLLRYEIALPFLLFFLVARRWRVLAGAAVSGSLLILASFAMVGRDFPRQYFGICKLLSESHNSRSAANMPTVRGLLAAVVPLNAHQFAAVAVLSLALLIWGLRPWSRWNGNPADLDTLFPMALVISLLVDYQGYIYNMTSLLLPGLLLVRRHPRASGYLWVCAAATLATTFAPRQPFGLITPLFLGIAIWIKQGSSLGRLPEV